MQISQHYRGKVSVYDKSVYTYTHEMGHLKLGTRDSGPLGNAYGFETWVFDNENYIMTSPRNDFYNEPAIRWQQGIPISGNYNTGDFTDWGKYFLGDYQW